MTSGTQVGTSGSRARSPRVAAFTIIAAATVLFALVNVLSQLDERSWMNRPIDWWRPTVWEASSGIVLLLLATIPMLMVERFPPVGPRWPAHIAAHAAATVPFSLVHVLLMVALRHAAYAIAGESYDFGFGWSTWFYEYRKDVISYAIYAAVFLLSARLLERPAPSAAAEPDSFLIDEGQRMIRVSAAQLLAARSSGNYVEFLLIDGRRPLMRATLAGLEPQLARLGLVRTHRSWLVNPAQVVEVAAEGSGDHGLRLVDGTEAPLSRRFPDALATMRRTA